MVNEVAAQMPAAQAILEPAANTPPYLQAEPSPDWTSSEFITTLGVHLLNLLAVLLDMLHIDWHKGLSTLQGLIPIAALVISAVVQIAFQNHRTRLKIAHVEKTAAVKLEQVKAVTTTLGPTVMNAVTMAEASDPEVKQKLGAIQDAVSRLEAAAKSDPSQPVSEDEAVSASAQEPAAADDPVSDPTCGGLYLTGDAAAAQLAAEASIPAETGITTGSE